MFYAATTGPAATGRFRRASTRTFMPSSARAEQSQIALPGKYDLIGRFVLAPHIKCAHFLHHCA